MSESVIHCQDLGHWYQRDRWLFRNYSFAIASGSVLAILGANGAGKTTLLRTILQLVKPKEGSVAVHKRLGFVPQLFDMRFDYTVLDVVLMGRVRQIGLWNSPSAMDRQMATKALRQFGLEALAHRSFQNLSGGQRQMVMVARALASGSEMLVMDEPTSFLDLRNQQMILQWIDRLSVVQGLTVIFTTHNPQHAQSVATQVLLMSEDCQFQFGSVADVLHESNLKTLYGVDVRKVEIQQGDRSFTAVVPLFKRKPL